MEGGVPSLHREQMRGAKQHADAPPKEVESGRVDLCVQSEATELLLFLYVTQLGLCAGCCNSKHHVTVNT